MSFTQLEEWLYPPIGTLGFVEGQSLFDHAIERAEPRWQLCNVRPEEPSFTPSHVFMVASRDHVVEAAMDHTRNSVAAPAPNLYYHKAFANGWVRLFTPPGDMLLLEDAVLWLQKEYSQRPYGWPVLIGFLLQDLFKMQRNPLGNAGDVCSQAAWIMLANYRDRLVKAGNLAANELSHLLAALPEVNCDPMNLCQVVQASH